MFQFWLLRVFLDHIEKNCIKYVEFICFNGQSIQIPDSKHFLNIYKQVTVSCLLSTRYTEKYIKHPEKSKFQYNLFYFYF